MTLFYVILAVSGWVWTALLALVVLVMDVRTIRMKNRIARASQRGFAVGTGMREQARG